MADFRNVSGIASKFMNVSIGNIFRIATKTQQLASFGSTLFTNADYQSIRNPFGNDSDVSLSTLRKYGIIEVAEVRTTKVYTTSNRWSMNDVIPMTDAQYEMLPDYFKNDVVIQIRKTYYYRINFTHAAQLLTFADTIASVEED